MNLKTYTVSLELMHLDAETPEEAVRLAFASMRCAPDHNLAFYVLNETSGGTAVINYQDAAAGHSAPANELAPDDLLEAARDAAATLESLMAHYGSLMPEADRRGREQTLADLRGAIAKHEPAPAEEPSDAPGA